MLKRLINQIREQIRLARMNRQIRQAELDRIRDRHRRRHPEKNKNSAD
ncbi:MULTISPECIES: hypothetical protein [Cyanophyceae]|nr:MULTISPECIES: hypothetical protein [Cyanophyceae]SMH48543.1 hypothetical protein SAMN06272755_1963 [Picosynechococcus sp. OG1]SMQ81335.1 hypothetical protein SAMN06272774_1240 [Synechococcus sp. 7002]